jgi:hypothetical protein
LGDGAEIAANKGTRVLDQGMPCKQRNTKATDVERIKSCFQESFEVVLGLELVLDKISPHVLDEPKQDNMEYFDWGVVMRVKS